MALAVKRSAGMTVAESRRWMEPRLRAARWGLLDGPPDLECGVARPARDGAVPVRDDNCRSLAM
jgi:hypothetical protein